jgi:hypothetical protein
MVTSGRQDNRAQASARTNSRTPSRRPRTTAPVRPDGGAARKKQPNGITTTSAKLSSAAAANSNERRQLSSQTPRRRRLGKTRTRRPQREERAGVSVPTVFAMRSGRPREQERREQSEENWYRDVSRSDCRLSRAPPAFTGRSPFDSDAGIDVKSSGAFCC